MKKWIMLSCLLFISAILFVFSSCEEGEESGVDEPVIQARLRTVEPTEREEIEKWEWWKKNGYGGPAQPIILYVSLGDSKLKVEHDNGPFFSTGNTMQYVGLPEDYKPEDGWVLIAREFGNHDNYVDIPYVIMYNKYRSTLRFFYYISNLSQYPSYCEVQLSTSSDDLSILSLDNDSIEKKSVAVGKVGIKGWSFVDFSIGYDSTLKENQFISISIVGVLESTYSFTGSLSLNGTITTPGTSAQSRGLDILEAGKEFQKGYKTGRKYPAKIQKGYTDAKKTLTTFAEDLDDLFGNKSRGLNTVAGLAYGAYQVWNAMQPSGATNPIVQPIELVGHFEMVGSSRTAWDPFQTKQFMLPGSKITNNTYYYSEARPVYNKPLGVIEVVNKPIVLAHRIIDDSPYDILGCPQHAYTYRYGLRQPLLVNINTSEIKVLSLKAAFASDYFENADSLVNLNAFYNQNNYFSGKYRNMYEDDGVSKFKFAYDTSPDSGSVELPCIFSDAFGSDSEGMKEAWEQIYVDDEDDSDDYREFYSEELLKVAIMIEVQFEAKSDGRIYKLRRLVYPKFVVNSKVLDPGLQDPDFCNPLPLAENSCVKCVDDSCKK